MYRDRILILGRTGMLGHMVEYILVADGRFAVRGVGRAEFDAEGDTRALDVFLRDTEYVINCIGVTARNIDDVDAGSVARAIRVNAEFPHMLAMAAGARGVRVMHMSTDGVFSGRSVEPYTEVMAPDATDTYGRTKILGESREPNVLNIRCSIVGPSPVKREGLWEWVASQSDGATVDGYTNHVWHGVTTMQFADLCARILAEDQFDTLRVDGHALHFAPNIPTSKADLIAAIAAAIGKRITVRRTAHEQTVRRVLAIRSGITSVLGGNQLFIAALRACAMAPT